MARKGERDTEVAKRRAKAIELRTAGLTYEQIAVQHPDLGYKSRHHVRKDVERALNRIVDEPARNLLGVEQQRLERMTTALWAKAMKGDTKAVDSLVRVMGRRARLLGLDADMRGQDGAGLDEQRGMIGALADGLQQAYAAMGDDTGDDE